jgi:hypothetical protein
MYVWLLLLLAAGFYSLFSFDMDNMIPLGKSGAACV